MANEVSEYAAVVEDALQGKTREVDDVGSTNPAELEIPDLDIGIEAEPEAKADDTPDKKPEAAKPKLPWNRDKQKSDQELAATRKELAKAQHDIEELRATVNGSPTKDLDAAMTALETLEAPEPPDEFATDEEKEAYGDTLKTYRAEHKRLTGQVKELTAKALKAEPEKPVKKGDSKARLPKSSPDADDDSAPSEDDFDSMCRDAAIEYGSRHDDVARSSVVKEIGNLGFTEGRWPNKAQLQKIVTRVYRETADRSEAKTATRQDRQEADRPAPSRQGKQNLTFEEVCDIALAPNRGRTNR